MAQEETKRVTKKRKVEEQKALTLLDAVEQIAEQAQNSALSEAFFKKAAKPINYIVDLYRCLPMQKNPEICLQALPVWIFLLFRGVPNKTG